MRKNKLRFFCGKHTGACRGGDGPSSDEKKLHSCNAMEKCQTIML
ncbi:hypothetical protein HMPREF3033_00630 [Veillonellaceae bacterium DNF00751]|nr:hypothetical protein HMPREF3033_00630 [Veillonellaceae bacterium DNF00751]